jgi:hypothetical protein
MNKLEFKFDPFADMDLDELCARTKPPEISAMQNYMVDLLYKLPDMSKLQMFMDSLKAPKLSRLRKDMIRELSRASNRPEKDLQMLGPEKQAEIFVRKLVKINGDIVCVVAAAAVSGCYVPAALRLLPHLEGNLEKALQYFQTVRSEVPDGLWDYVLSMVEKKPTENQQKAIRMICDSLESGCPTTPIPFAVGDPPRWLALEQHLVDLHVQVPATARPLIASLLELCPNRPKTWLLVSLTDAVAAKPVTPVERAWWLAGKLYAWGNDLKQAHQLFPRENITGNEDAIRVLYGDPELAEARQLVGEYLIRQLALGQQMSLMLDVIPPDMVREHTKILMPQIADAAIELARGANLERVRGLLGRFPDLKARGILAIALRRSGQFEAAAAELRNSKIEPEGERQLVEAGIANAFDLEIPEDAGKQDELQARLEAISACVDSDHLEICYCRALHSLLCGTFMAEDAYDDLCDLPNEHIRVVAYRLLAAIISADIDGIESSLDVITEEKAEETLASIPTNLLKSGIRALLVHPDPEELICLTSFLYAHTPEMLDPLLGQEDLLLTNPQVLARLLDTQDHIEDAIQRWAGYQRALDIATRSQNISARARAIDSCLSVQEPFLATYQAKLLQQQITQCTDLDLQEALVQRLVDLHPQEAKPYLYQLLRMHMGNQRQQDAWRILETLREIGEDTTETQDCFRVLQPICQPEVKGVLSNGSLPYPVSVGFFGGDVQDKPRTEQLRQTMMQKHPGLTVEFDHSGWNVHNHAALVSSVAKFDIIVASNLMRTDLNRSLRAKTRESGKVFGFCRNRGMATIEDSIVNAVKLHIANTKPSG